jgi:hypothetical protein
VFTKNKCANKAGNVQTWLRVCLPRCDLSFVVELHIQRYDHARHGDDAHGCRNGARMLCHGRRLFGDVSLLHLNSMHEHASLGTGKILEDERCRKGTVRVFFLTEHAMQLIFLLRVQPDPKETYQQALEKAGTPTDILVNGNPLNKTSVISDDDYISNYNALVIFEDMEATHERFG